MEENGRKIRQISIFGFADAGRDDPLYKEAYEASQILAQHDYVIINGGGPGVMRAASEGAKAVGGKTIGVTFYPKDISRFEGRDQDNPLDEEVVTENYLERTLKLLELGDAYLIFKGGTGTISEFGMAWGLARLYFGHHKPLILYGAFWQEVISSFIRSMRMRPEELKVYRVVNSAQEVLAAIELFEEMFSHEHHPFQPNERAFQL
ncbi:LOG family protein [Candidatus Microgenomates bacterium]|nr:LOG family protein [Candidatus Microgenomates bacterium]